MSLISRISRQAQSKAAVHLRVFSSAEAAAASKKFYDVPEGHIDSDLSQTACNIGLNRRRDLKIGAAGNIKLNIDGKSVKISDLFKDKLTVLFGVPNRGKVCSETHLPGYLAELDSLRKQGVDQILCISVGDGQTVAEWGSKLCPSNDIMVAADVNGGLTRLLGMDLDPASPTDPASLRYAIALEDGIILKVKVEENAGDVKESSARSVVKFLQSRPQANK